MYAPHLLHYDWQQYKFGTTVRKMLNVDDLTALRGEDHGVVGVVSRKTDQASLLHKRFYSYFETLLKPEYERLVAEITPQVFPGETVYYQKVPTFRIQFPENLAVGEFHRDSDFGHQDGVLNVWVPLTPAFDSNTIWVERYVGLNSTRAWQLAPGDALVFDAVNWIHGNRRNYTRCSRVSFDFRLITKSRYQDSDARAVNTGRRLALGDYYTELGER